jgi:HPt (histidine-containing phosphotransfer) domain-containing protein
LLDIVAEKRQYSFDMFTESSCSAPQTMTSAINLPGLDIAAALKTFGGDEKKYRELLCKFVVQHGGDADEARRLFGAKDPKGATSLLHGLSGVAGLLQATRLARLAATAEGALLDGNSDVMPVLFDQLQGAMHTVKESVNKFDATGS